jgi:hypothetical protein
LFKYIFYLLLIFYTTLCFGENLKFDPPSKNNWIESTEISLSGLARYNLKKNPEIKILISTITADMKKAKSYSDQQLLNEISQGKILTDKILNYNNIKILESNIKREKNCIIVLKKESYQKGLISYTRVLKTYIYNNEYFSSELIWSNDLPADLIKNANNDFSSIKVYE